jgi:hypothetical protein
MVLHQCCLEAEAQIFENLMADRTLTSCHQTAGKMTPIRIGVTARVPRTLLAPTTSSYDGFNIPTTKRARWCFCNVRCVHPRFGPSHGHLRYSASSNRIWHRVRPPNYDSREFPSTLQRRTPESRLSRTRCPTIRILSTLGGLVVMYARHSTGN